MRIRNNISALNINNNSKKSSRKLAKSLEKLSSGYKINRASDDAAGLAISEKMRSQIRGLNMASKNIQDGISLIQTAEGALNEVHSLLQRGRELSVQAANDVNTNNDRKALQREIDELLKEIDRIANTTHFNNRQLLNISTSQTTSINQTGSSAVNTPTHALIIHSSINYQNNYYIKEGLNDSLSISFGGNTIKIKIPENTYDNSTFLSELNNQLQGTNIFTAKYSDDLTKLEIVSDNPNITIDSVSGNLAATIVNPTSTTASTGGNYRITGFPALNPGITITSNNNTLTFEVDSITYSIQLAEGNYIVYPPNQSDKNINSPLLTEMNNKLAAENAPITAGFIYLKDSPPLDGTCLTFTVVSSALNSGNTVHTIGNFGGTAKNIFFEKFLNDWTLEDDTTTPRQFSITQTPASITSAKTVTEPVQIITGQNDTLFFNINGVATSITLNPGTYSKSQLIDELNNQFNLNNIDLIASVNQLNKLTISMNTYQQGSSISNIGGNAANSLFFDAGTVSFSVTSNNSSSGSSSQNDQLFIQVGANRNQSLPLELCDVRTKALNLEGLSVQFQADAENSITRFDQGINLVSNFRSKFGAYQNRLEHSYEKNINSSENLQCAESRIRDTDMAKEMMKYTKYNILLQASQALLAQSNSSSRGILQVFES